MSRLLCALLIVALAPGCATVRSRDLTPTADQPRIENDQFFRGDDEKLDEQEFYQLVGDRESYDAIRGPRLAAQNTQFLWIALTLVGLAAAGFGAANMIFPKGGPLGDNGLFQPIFPNPADGSFNYIPYAITAGGAVLFGIGIGLLVGSEKRVNPTELKFDIFHAKESAKKAGIDPDAPAPNSYEGKRLADEKRMAAERVADDERRRNLKRTDIAKVELSLKGDDSTFSSEEGGEVRFRFVDAKGETLDFLSTEGILTWTSEPAGFVDGDGKWSNPLRKSLKYLGTKLVITATVTGTSIKNSVTLTQDLSSPSALVADGDSGRPGSDGADGTSGTAGDRNRPRGQSGQHGTSGGSATGPGDARIEAAFVQDTQGESYILLVNNNGDRLYWTLTDAPTASAHGRGHKGGRGGNGGSGGKGWTPYEDCLSPGDGADGGDGGDGGNGSDGPSLAVDAASAAVLKRLDIKSRGGSGGDKGRAGYAGTGGYDRYCKYGRPGDGKSGRNGRDGKEGAPGSAGSVDTNVVSKGALKWVDEWLKENPSLKLDDDGLDTDEVPAKKKGKKR